MKSKMYFLAGTLSLALISCKGYHEILVSTHTQDIAGKNRLYTIPLTVDLNIASSRVTGSYSSKQLVSVEYAKTQANADALQKANADILIEPQYYVEIKDNKIEAQVVGYPAHYKNFRKVTGPTDTLATRKVVVVKPNTVIDGR